MAEVTVSFGAWKTGHAEPTQHRVPVSLPKPGPKLEPVSSALRQQLMYPRREEPVVSLRFSPNGKRLLAGDYPGGKVVVWDTDNGNPLIEIDAGYGDRGGLDYVFPTPDWKSIFVSKPSSKYQYVEQDGKRKVRWQFNGMVRMWDLASGKLVRTFQHQPPRNILSMKLSPDGKTFFTADELPGTYERDAKRTASLWDVQTGQFVTLPDGLRGLPCFSGDGRMFVDITMDANRHATAIKCFDTNGGREKWSVPVRDKDTYVDLLAVSPDGRFIVGEYRIYEHPKKWDRYQSKLKWWASVTGQELGSFDDPPAVFGRAVFSKDGAVLAVTQIKEDERNLLLFRAADRHLMNAISLAKLRTGERLVISRPAFSPDGKWLAVETVRLPDASKNLGVEDMEQPRIHLVDVAAGAIRETLVAPQSRSFPMVCFSPDGKTLASTAQGKVLLWDLSQLPGIAARGP